MFMYLMFKPTLGGGRTRNFYAEHFALVYKHLLIWTVYTCTITNGRHSFHNSTTICLSKRSYMYIAIIGRSVRCLADVDRPTVFFFYTKNNNLKKNHTSALFISTKYSKSLFKHDL